MKVLVHPLEDNQRGAVSPGSTVWLNASAGTGKTQVLSARVLRLLLEERVSPSQILCLTFTKAGAAEMANRVNDVLASWVRMPETRLAGQLKAIGADWGKATVARARTLFAQVLDCPGGGLRIDTIHAFSQWLLAAFPVEAGLTPGARAMEDRDRTLLAREVLSALLVEAEARGDAEVLDALALLSLRMGPDAVEAFLLRCAEAREAWEGPGSWIPPLAPKVRRLLGLADDEDEATIAALCADDAFASDALRLCLSAYSSWNGKKGQDGRVVIADWLAAEPAARLAALPGLHRVLFTQKDTVKDVSSLEKFEGDFGFAAAAVLEAVLAIRSRRALLDLSRWLAPALTLGRRFALAWEEAKARDGLIDFDDQIRLAADLLTRKDMAGWIRYKLDRQFDHILVDEAQDTNAAQWTIIDALTEEFFAGRGQRDDAVRTLFVVGDTKQAIFGFQGTSPENFARARDRVFALIDAARSNAAALRENAPVADWAELDLGRSYRTARPVLEFVDEAIRQIGPVSFGLTGQPDPHLGEDRPGLVTLWQPVGAQVGDEDDGEDDEGQESWLSRPDRLLADRVARQVAAWMKHGFALSKGTLRRATPGDVMVLVRKRKELASLIVSRLHVHGVPVAGVDRLRLGAPLGVKDLIAALRFAVQPGDDLSLAALLVSPLFGWTQEQLLEHGWRPDKVRLWRHLRNSRLPLVAEAVERLRELLAKADQGLPQELLHWLLVGPWQGRTRLVARLGREVNDPLDELLNAAHAYASGGDAPSLVGFLRWFDAGDGELKREAEGAGGLVRVMTVHGAKGLQAPIVILADAADDPDSSKAPSLTLSEPRPPGANDLFANPEIPLPGLRKEERHGRIEEAAEARKAAEREEHWRLLYVAMTRAEEALFVTGSLRKGATEPKPDSWYARLGLLFAGDDGIKDDIWGRRWERGALPPAPPKVAEALQLDLGEGRPPWLEREVAAEPRPPRPLAPSSLGEGAEAADPPYPPGAGREAARRGTLIHALLERLPAVPAEARGSAAGRWLVRAAPDLSAAARAEIAEAASRVLSQPGWDDLFGPDALAEVPVAALVGNAVVAGTIDRLLVTSQCIRVVDFKTARRPPADAAGVPVAIVRQMAAYVAALEATYPGRRVEAAVLYTHSPALIVLPDALLAPHKAVFEAAQESL